MIKYMAAAVAVAVSGGVAVPVAVPVAGLTKRFFNQKDFLINVWGYMKFVRFISFLLIPSFSCFCWAADGTSLSWPVLFWHAPRFQVCTRAVTIPPFF